MLLIHRRHGEAFRADQIGCNLGIETIAARQHERGISIPIHALQISSSISNQLHNFKRRACTRQEKRSPIATVQGLTRHSCDEQAPHQRFVVGQHGQVKKIALLIVHL